MPSSIFRGSCQDADAVGSRCLGLIECPHDSARTAVSTVAPPTLLRLLLAIIVGVLALQSLFVDVAAVVTLISGRFELIYLPAEFFAGKVRDTTGFSGFNGFEAISSSWHFVLEPTGTRRHLTDSEWNSTQAAMRADALSEAKAECTCGGRVASTDTTTTNSTKASFLAAVPGPTVDPRSTVIPSSKSTPPAAPVLSPTEIETSSFYSYSYVNITSSEPTVVPTLTKELPFTFGATRATNVYSFSYANPTVPTAVPISAPTSSPSLTKQPTALPSSSFPPSFAPSLQPTTFDTFSISTSFSMTTSAVLESQFSSLMRTAVAKQIGVDVSLVKNLVLEDVTPDAPCGCEIVGGYNFCNFDYGFTGFCELCSYYITNEDCYTSGFELAGAEDCAFRCFKKDFNQTLFEANFNSNYYYSVRRLSEEPLEPEPIPTRSQNLDVLPSRLSSSATRYLTTLYEWGISFDVTQSLADSNVSSPESFLTSTLTKLQEVVTLEAEIASALDIEVVVDSSGVTAIVATRSPSPVPTMAPSVACPAGTIYIAIGLAPPSCEPCKVGKYSNTIKPPWNTACTSCEVGRYADKNGSSYCALCDYGTVQPNSGSKSCIDCPPGQFEGSLGALSCSGTCEAGKFSTGGNRNCSYCPLGFIQTFTGQASCVSCAPGELASDDRLTCSSCAAGTYVENRAICVDCDAGRYAPTAQVDECLACDAGSATGLNIAAISCTKCIAGTFSKGLVATCSKCPVGQTSAAAAEECTVCEAGKFNDKTGAQLCTDCPAGKFEVSNSSIACTECPVGRSQVATGQLSCADCVAGTYNPGTGMSACVACAGDTYSKTAATECDACVRGFYYSNDGYCLECPIGTSCEVDGATTQQQLLIKPGYWRITPTTMVIRQCPLFEGCLGGTNFSNFGLSYCNEGYMGPLCATCVVPGYFFNAELLTCEECEADGGSSLLTSSTPIIIALVFVLMIIAAISIACSTSKPPVSKGEAAKKNILKEMMDSACIQAWLQWIMATNKKIKKASVKLKALMAFSQISVNVQFNCSIQYPVNFTKLLDSLGFANLDLLPSLGMQCYVSEFDYISSMVSVTIIPLVIATVLGVAYLSVGCCKPRPKHSMRKLRKKYVVPPPLKAVFPNVAIVAFRRTFAAYDNDFSGTVDAQELMDMFKEIGQKISKEQIDEMVKETDLDGDGEISFGEFLFMMHRSRNRNRSGTAGLAELSYAVEAKANLAHGQSIFYVLLLLTFCVLISTSTTLFQYFKCNYFPEAEEYMGEPKGWLFKDYSIDCYSARYKQYTLFALVMIFVYPIGIPLSYYLLLRQHRYTLFDADAVAREAKEDFPTIGHLIFLVEAYKPRYYYFEVIKVIRRLLLASVIGVVDAESAAAPTIGLLICFVFLYIFIDFKPYKSKSNCNLGIILQYSIALLFLSALLIKVNATSDSNNDQVILGYFLMVVLLAGPTMITLQLIGTFYKVKKHSNAEKLAQVNTLENDYLKSIGLNGVEGTALGNVDVDEGVIDVANHFGVLDDGKKVPMAKWCKCGNDFRADTLFCRKCGSRRPILKEKISEGKADQGAIVLDMKEVDKVDGEVIKESEEIVLDYRQSSTSSSESLELPATTIKSSDSHYSPFIEGSEVSLGPRKMNTEPTPFAQRASAKSPSQQLASKTSKNSSRMKSRPKVAGPNLKRGKSTERSTTTSSLSTSKSTRREERSKPEPSKRSPSLDALPAGMLTAEVKFAETNSSGHRRGVHSSNSHSSRTDERINKGGSPDVKTGHAQGQKENEATSIDIV